MGFWSKLGKIGLQAAPYVAAPFTGGASLAFAPIANRASGMINTSPGFDRTMGVAGNIAGMAGGAGAFDRFGNMGGDVRTPGGNLGTRVGTPGGAMNAVPTGRGGGGIGPQVLPSRSSIPGGVGGYSGTNLPSKSSIPGGVSSYKGGWQENLRNIGNQMSGKKKEDGEKKGVDWKDLIGKGVAAGATAYGAYKIKDALENPSGNYGAPRQHYGAADTGSKSRGMDRFRQESERGLGPVMGGTDQRNPNLAEGINAGRLEAIKNQPFRRGYDVHTFIARDPETDEPIIGTDRMPGISVGRYGRGGRGGGRQENAGNYNYGGGIGGSYGGDRSGRSGGGNRGGGEPTYQPQQSSSGGSMGYAAERRRARGLDY